MRLLNDPWPQLDGWLSLKRFERISPRYPGWTLVTPPEPNWDGDF